MGKDEKSEAVPKPTATLASARRPALPLVNLSLAVMLLAVMLVVLRPSWIPSLQTQPSSTITNPFHDVFEWILNQGASVGDLEIVAVGGYYELVASARLEKGQALLSVPMNLILDENTILEDDTVQAVLGTTNALDDNGAAVVFLLAHQDRWGAYLDMIQSLDVPSPLFWAPDEIALVRGSMLVRMMDELNGVLQEQFVAVEPFFDGLSLEVYMRLWVNVNSRMWQLQKSETESVGALMPVFDFATHALAPNVEVGYDADLDAIVMTSVTVVDRAQPIHNFYYNTSNAHHLLLQGFTVESNDDNLACEIDLNGRRCSVETSVERPVTDALVACIREQSSEAMATLKEIKSTWDQISNSASTALMAFPDTIDDDDRLLLQEEVASNTYNAIQARRSEKLCLSAAISFSRTLAEALESNKFNPATLAGMATSSALTQEYLDSIRNLAEDGSN